jgi:hypothetical protein
MLGKTFPETSNRHTLNGNQEKLSTAVVLFVVATITVLVYLPGMSAGFYFDDEPNLTLASALHWSEFSLQTLQHTLTGAQIVTRPLANVSLAATYRLAGLDPAPYHWTNLVIHLGAGLALFWVLRIFQQLHAPQRAGIWVAAFAVLVFLIHPLNIQAVTYVVQRMTSMAALFVLLGFGSYLTARYHSTAQGRRRWFGFASLCFLLAIASKEVGLLLLPLIALYEACFNGPEWVSRFRKAMSGVGPVVTATGTVLSIGLIIAATLFVFGDSLYWSETMPRRDYSGYERLLTQGRVLFFYVSLLFWPTPSRLNLDHDFIVSRSLFDPVTTVLAAAGWMVILWLALRNARSRPQLAFPVLAFLLLHSIEAGPVNLELVFEHRMYLPMTMLALLMALNIGPLRSRSVLPGIVASSVIVLALATATYQRNVVWGDELEFARDCAVKSPDKWRPQYNLGTKLGERGLIAEAKEALEHAVSLKPADSSTNNHLANVYMILGQVGAAEKHYRTAIDSDPKNAEALFNYAKLLESEGRVSEQKKMLEQFLIYAPPYLEAQKRWAAAYLTKIQNPSRQR